MPLCLKRPSPTAVFRLSKSESTIVIPDFATLPKFLSGKDSASPFFSGPRCRVLSRWPKLNCHEGPMVINFRTRMTTSYAELGETCVATTAQLGIVVFFCCAYATATFRPVMPISILCDTRTSLDATLAKCRCVVARAEKKALYHSAGVVDTRHFAKIRVSQGDLRSKLNRHVALPHCRQGHLTLAAAL